MDHQDSVPRAKPESTKVQCEFAKQETICLELVSQNKPFRMSRQMRPSLSKSGALVRTDVRVVNASQKAYFWRSHRVVFRQEEL